MARHETFTRFHVAQRIEHIILVISFSTLAVTGLVQKYSHLALPQSIIGLLGGIEPTRIIHHAAAIIFVLQSIYHTVVVAYKIFVLRQEMSMLPGVKDITDAISAVRYNLGLAKDRPKLPRYGFEEKAEYWAMLWGTVIMAITGFMLWNPVLLTRFLPGEAIPAAKAAHGGEAVLAVLSIFVWHSYHVHMKTFNKSMFTGKLTRHQMEEEHAQELARIESGTVRPAPSPEVVRQRSRQFFPVAIPLSVLLAAGLLWFTAVETTAIETVPTPSVTVFAPLPTPVVPAVAGTPSAPSIAGTPAASSGLASTIPHPIEGREDCLMCHALTGIQPMPPDHEGRANNTCVACHKLDAGVTGTRAAPAGGQAGAAGAIPHAIDTDAYRSCEACHAAGRMRPWPANHASFTNETCTSCHQLQAGAAEPGATAAASGGAGDAIPHAIDNDTYRSCENCHAAGRMRPWPANHASLTNETCTGCHQPPAGATAPAATTAAAPAVTPAAAATATPAATAAAPGGAGAADAIPHAIDTDTYRSCEACHAAGRMRPWPANHATFTNQMCTSCHQPPAGTEAPAATPAAAPAMTPAATPAATAAASGGAGAADAIPHAIDNATYQSCENCHAAGRMRPWPANHASFTNQMCTSCHEPES